MVDWFYTTNAWFTLPLFVGGFVLVSCLVVVALRPVVVRRITDTEEWDRTLGHVIGTFGMFFGILLALVAVSVYENYSDTRGITVEEAGKVGALYRATTGLPDEVGEPMRGVLDEYMQTVIEQDFPDQQAGILPEASLEQVNAFDELMHDVEANTLTEQAELKQVLDSFEGFIDARRARIDATALALPGLFWLVIWVGAAVNAVLIAFMSVKSLRMHLLMAGLLALFIGLVIFVTADMDRPYAGNVAVNSGAYQRVYEQIIDAR